MKYEKTCSVGSFKVWGAGLRFNYEAPKKLVTIAPLDEERALAHLKLDRHLSKNPLAYVESLDKTNQINALMYSDNATIDLLETLDRDRIASLVKTTAIISRLAFDLNAKCFDRFSKLFCQQFDLKSIKIKKFNSTNSDRELYLGRIQTRHNNSVCVRSQTLADLTAGLSERILHDLITMEFGYRYNNSAHMLLNASSNLSTISRVLDQNFIPKHKLNRYQSLENTFKASPSLNKKEQ